MYILLKKIVNIFGPQSKTCISLLFHLELQIKLMLVIFSRMFELLDGEYGCQELNSKCYGQ